MLCSMHRKIALVARMATHLVAAGEIHCQIDRQQWSVSALHKIRIYEKNHCLSLQVLI